MLIRIADLIGRTIEAHLTVATINALLVVILLAVLGIDNLFFLGAIVFLSGIIPVVGPIVASLLVFAIAVMQDGGSLMLAAEALIAMLIVHVVTSLFVAPRIYGKSFHLHSVAILVILVIEEFFFGAWGLILGVPVAVYLLDVTLHGGQKPVLE